MKKIILIIIICSYLGTQAQNQIIDYSNDDGLVSNCIDFIAQDVNGDMWFVSGEPWAPTKWTDTQYFGREIEMYVDQEYGLVGESIQYAQKLSTKYGVSRFDGENWTTYKNKKDGLADKKIKHLFKDSKGWLFFITMDDGISIWDGREMNIVNKKNGLGGDYVYDIIEDSKGNIWVGTNGGVSMFDGNSWNSWGKKSGVGSSHMRSISEDSFGNIWVSYEISFNIYISSYDGNWRHFSGKEGP